MDDIFIEKLNEAKSFFEVGLPFWCDHFSRPTVQEFKKHLINNGFDIYYLFFDEFYEGVYSPNVYSPEELEQVATRRNELRKAGVSESELPSSLKQITE
jgi:hypothetical protein